MSTREVHEATYYYPGVFMPETVNRDLEFSTLEDAIRYQPDEKYYFKKDGWYAVRIKSFTQKLFESSDGEQRWLNERSKTEEKSFVVGRMRHWEDLPDDGKHEILRSNIRNNSKDGYGVLTRCGNWQMASDYDYVISEELAVRS